MTEWMQDVTVTSIAALAAGVVLRRVMAFVQPVKHDAAGCSSCASRPRTCAARESQSAAETTIPVQLHTRRTGRNPAP